MLSYPPVSIICLCHNHAPYVQEALQSAWGQAWPSLELIVVDDASTDGSVEVIREWLQDKPEVQFIRLEQNVGNCRAFNQALARARGAYVIDLAADDVLLPERVRVGVEALEAAGPQWGVHFTDAWYINAQGKVLKAHYKRDIHGTLRQPVPQGWVYRQVLERYFICTPSMMMRRSVLEALGGYDEQLAYEDFDFWVRSARQWQYCYTDQILVKKRVLPRSWGARQYQAESRQLASTLAVCQKAKTLNRTPEEDYALGRRLRYELRQAIRHKHRELAKAFFQLKREVWPESWRDWLYARLLR
ncbi:glycosyltransferase family 2 protein [Cesiribacter andamanensis]|uniref:Chondroitin polymerase n=1 Tax=Cesiribacter andamanensis AMV16 TaxID=1279009 RepID=M7NPC4_9BACT|nr:glycosyltransferase [Cesiribacter andamanensis]EMR03575.1 Chondroitin polymerase [Cesiribacter andamanensis AMV16]